MMVAMLQNWSFGVLFVPLSAIGKVQRGALVEGLNPNEIWSDQLSVGHLGLFG